MLGGALTITAFVDTTPGPLANGPHITCYKTSNAATACSSTLGSAGIGIRWNSGNVAVGGTEVDADPRLEWFHVTVNSGVWRLLEVGLANFTGNEQWRISFNNGSTFTNFTNLGDVIDLYPFNQTIDSNGVRIGLVSTTSDFRLYSLTFEEILEPIPEPTTYGLIALGLVGLGLAARRRATK